MNVTSLPLFLVAGIFGFIMWSAFMVDGSHASNILAKSTTTDVQTMLASSQPVMLEFSASWCGPCQQVAPVVRELASEVRGRAHVVQVDVDQDRGLAMKYNVSSIPCFIVVKKGKQVSRQVGGISKAEMMRMLDL